MSQVPDLTIDGAFWHLQESLESWLAKLSIPVTAALRVALDSSEALLDGNKFHLKPKAISALSDLVAAALGLPARSPLPLDIRLQGNLGQEQCELVVRWLQPGRAIGARGVERDGPWLSWQGLRYRIPHPLLDVIEKAEAFNAIEPGDLDGKFRAWADIRACLGDEGASRLTDGMLRSLRVVTATALTFGITTDQKGHVQVEPVLLHQATQADGEVRPQRALTPSDEALFAQRLDALHDGAQAFPIEAGLYVVVDEPLRQALQAVRQIRRLPPDERKRAALQPEAVMRELLGQSEDTPSVFIETESYADRVKDVGQWQAPILPWVKVESQSWDAPVEQGIRVDGKDIPLSPELLRSLHKDLQAAIAQGKPKVALPAGGEISATAANLAAIGDLVKMLDRADQRDAAGLAKDDGEASSSVLIIETNFNSTGFSQIRRQPRKSPSAAVPSRLKTTLKPHQLDGLRWLQSHWRSGSRGAMLCDDMGLGKTLQALTFCLWLREGMELGQIAQKPILVVAPVGLLRNWEAEIRHHLVAPGLGHVLRAYGDDLRRIKRGSARAGNASLDTTALSGADVILANYEAVTTYQLSFGAIPLAALIMDEAQRIKSPANRGTHAIKALNTDFALALTGTPVENRLADLWCIADAVQPGALADLRTFSQRYERDDSNVSQLRSAIWQDESAISAKSKVAEAPQLLLRRLKTQKLEGLPGRTEHVIEKRMPSRQADAYRRALVRTDMSGGQDALAMLHGLRIASLHPNLVEGGAAACDVLDPNDSARFQGMLEVLDQVHAVGEKALVFVESLELHADGQLPELLRRRYAMPFSPLTINGDIDGPKRQQAVDEFQARPGFDVMLLSPRAGGVGITLTAANHVIHLSRWWNPAVEDQCSDRVHRIGQQRPVHIYYPVALLPGAEEASFDRRLQALMNRKRGLAQDLLAPPTLDKEDFEALWRGVQAAV